MTKPIKDRLKSMLCISSVTMVSIHVINKITFFLATRKDCLNTGAGNYYKWKFGKIYYKKQGQGKPLLLIHDLTAASSAHEWNRTVKKLSENHTVYTIDLIGCGRSAKPRLTYTSYMYVQLLSDFIRQIIGQKTDIAVTGLSASFVIMACKTAPELFDRIVLINPLSLSALSRMPNKRSRAFKTLLESPIVGTFVYNIYTGRCPIKNCMRKFYFNNKNKCSYKNTDAYYEAAHLGSSTARFLFASLKGRYVNIHIEQALKHMQNQILLITGADIPNADQLINEYTALNSSIKKGRIANTKHLPQLENPEALITKINEYLR